MSAVRPLLHRLLLQLLLLFLCYSLSRWVFFALHRSHFSVAGVSDYLRIGLGALRYDASAIAAVNALYILLLPVAPGRRFRDVYLQAWFVGSNLLALTFELCDWAYFPYNLRRSNADVLHLVARKGDFWALLPGFLRDYWYVPLALLALGICLWRINRRIVRATPLPAPRSVAPLPALRSRSVAPLWKEILGRTLMLLVCAGLCLLAIRGGFQYIPIAPRDALLVSGARNLPLVVNTPFSIITTYGQQPLQELDFMDNTSARRIVQPVKRYAGPFRPDNVVVIILESFSKEYTGIGGRWSRTRFLDSLMQLSLVCTQAYANGLHSAEGIPAILSGVPSLMDEALTTSSYGTNRFQSLVSCLKAKGYASAFYHGGTNGTMSFDIYAAAAGFDGYFGRKEYNDERDYDGNWGIRDQPFLQYFARGLGRLREPFVASVFTLSSHPPYTLPAGYEHFFENESPAERSVRYADESLRDFFRTASQAPWFPRTLFVLVADHASPVSEDIYYRTGMGRFAIPVLYYAPGDPKLRGATGTVTQQIDILPSVLDYLHYDLPFYALGSSVFDRGSLHAAVNWDNGQYQWLSGGYWLQGTAQRLDSLYAFPSDSFGVRNLVRTDTGRASGARNAFRAFLQCYTGDMIHDRMRAER